VDWLYRNSHLFNSILLLPNQPTSFYTDEIFKSYAKALIQEDENMRPEYKQAIANILFTLSPYLDDNSPSVWDDLVQAKDIEYSVLATLTLPHWLAVDKFPTENVKYNQKSKNVDNVLALEGLRIFHFGLLTYRTDKYIE
jgi:hypothetical protein